MNNNNLFNSGNNINMTCNACNGVILDKLMSKTSPDNKIWHSTCLKCSECNMLLDSKYFETSGRLYCRTHYLNFFGPSCFGCGNKITDEQYFFSIKQTIQTGPGGGGGGSMNGAGLGGNGGLNTLTNNLFFHDKCFSCNYCSKPLQKGDKYCIIDNSTTPSPTKTLMICHEVCALKYYQVNNNNNNNSNLQPGGGAPSGTSLQANPPAPRAKRGRMKQKPAQ